MLHVFAESFVGDAAFQYLGGNERFHVIGQFQKVELVLLEHRLPGAELAHIEHVVDQIEQVVRRYLDLVQALTGFRGVLLACSDDVEHA